jgi:hypothetical protein
MAKALELDAATFAAAPPVPRAAQAPAAQQTPSQALTGRGRKGKPKLDQMPLQVRWPRSEVKAAKLAAVEGDFPTVSDFMLACFHAYMKSTKKA